MKLQKSQTNIPMGKNANTERFILGLSLCLCLFMKNNASLLKNGKLLRNYTNQYAMQVPLSDAALVESKINDLLQKLRSS